MSNIDNNLVEIAKILIEMKQERQLDKVSPSVMSRYPEGSQGIVINENKFIVLNTQDNSEVSEKEKVNGLKDASLKYNPNFYFGTIETDEPDIIDFSHNKSKLINEAYTEVSFLPKDIFSTAELNPEEGKLALKTIIDRTTLGPEDFDEYKVEKSAYSREDTYDEIYRCRCIFNDISGNESVESLLIKAFKVSDKKGAEYSYQIIGNENIKELVDELENKVSTDTTGNIHSNYSTIKSEEYYEIKKHIEEGIRKYYTENSKKYYRLTRIDIKAIYCLRIKKNPIQVNLYSDNTIIAEFPTYYSMIAGDFNVFTCPNCGTLSGSKNDYNSIKIHVDKDFTNLGEEMLTTRNPIGCTNCMEKCKKCGKWHFKLSEYNNVIERGFSPVDKRRFLKNYADKNISAETLCECKEYLSWIYDEMSLVSSKGRNYHERIIDKFLSGGCKLVFINYLTGEVVADYDQFVEYVYEYLNTYLAKNADVYKKFKALRSGRNTKHKDVVYNFVDMYIVNEANQFDSFNLESYIEQATNDFKTNIANLFNISAEMIKCTSSIYTTTCNQCGSRYYKGANTEGEIYYNSVKDLCCCCAEADTHNYKLWNRADDGVTFYKPKNKDKAIKTYQTGDGEEMYDKWLSDNIKKFTDKLRSTKSEIRRK